MKILKYLFIIIAALVALFFGNGMFTENVSYENEVTVNKSAAEVWAIMEDDSRISEWLTVIDRMELVSGEAGTVGAVSNIYVTENGEEMVMQETITAVTPEERIAMTFTMDFMNMEYEMELTEMDGKTKITSRSVTTGNSLVAKSIIAFIPSVMQAQEQENLGKLKVLVDNNTKPY